MLGNSLSDSTCLRMSASQHKLPKYSSPTFHVEISTARSNRRIGLLAPLCEIQDFAIYTDRVESRVGSALYGWNRRPLLPQRSVLIPPSLYYERQRVGGSSQRQDVHDGATKKTCLAL
ncbi:unnamed protein product [Mesocestoides corti]|uniref:Uncharacterized protein n=1 Tax=Mesocestoides corti TaxID=53468 RepID=A0A0R3U9E6_MESCO|nr:unnamed protein product [Mesocestoides corti]